MARVAPLTPEYQARPYWWDEVELPQPGPAPMPSAVDVAVVGGGYTGLAAAWEIARGGRQRHRPRSRRHRRGGEQSQRRHGAPRWQAVLVGVSGRAVGAPAVGRDRRRLRGRGRARRPSSVSTSTGSAAATWSWRTIRASPTTSAPSPTRTRRSARRPDSSTAPSSAARSARAGSAEGLLVERSAGLHPAKLAAGLARAATAAGRGTARGDHRPRRSSDGAGDTSSTRLAGALRCDGGRGGDQRHHRSPARSVAGTARPSPSGAT